MSTADFVFVPDSEAGVTGVVTVPARTKILRYRPRVRTAVVIFCAALGAVFAAMFSQLEAPRLHFAPIDAVTASSAASLASVVCAFLLSSRLAISRSPALAALAATFTYSGILLAAHAWAGNTRGGWLWAAWALGCAVGITMFGAIDWYWARKQRRSAERGYYSDTRQRYKRLPRPKAMAVLFWANGIAIASATVIVWSSLRFAAAGEADSSAWAAWTVGAYAAAAVTLIFAPGHRTILRDWMIAAVAAGALSAAATIAVSTGGSEAVLVSTAYALIAALIPAAVLLCDAKIDMYVVDKQAAEIHELALVNDLTGLGTARAFGIHLERAIALADATRVGFDVAMFDVAGLRAANRDAGRNVGNELLVLTSRVIGSALQPGEFAARCKGDEFAALLMPGDAHAQNDLRARVANALDALGPRLERLDLALHVGVHRYDPLAPQSAESFMRAGWQRLFAEKTSVDTVRQS
ncbi:MAG TPA: GGDEF domain-containing protein [Candidatus Eremiobacteraceae bacterium]